MLDSPSSSPSPSQFVLSLVVDERAAQPTGVLVPVPGPPLHAAAAGLAGAVAVPYPLAEEQGWAVAGEALRQVLRQARVRCHPKVLCIVNPGDPTGELGVVVSPCLSFPRWGDVSGLPMHGGTPVGSPWQGMC